MDAVEVALKMINSVGFPVFVALALLWQNNQTAKYYQETFIKFRDTIEENTKAMQVLINQISRNHKGGD